MQETATSPTMAGILTTPEAQLLLVWNRAGDLHHQILARMEIIGPVRYQIPSNSELLICRPVEWFLHPQIVCQTPKGNQNQIQPAFLQEVRIGLALKTNNKPDLPGDS
jgi:hypothetical protein